MTAMASGEWREPPSSASGSAASVKSLADHMPPSPECIAVIESEPLTKVVSRPARFYRTHAKRWIDIVLASVLIVLLSPFMAATAILIAADSPGGVLYTQRRMGYGQSMFTMYKFRSMYSDSDNILRLYPEQSVHYATHWKLSHDPRVTRLGTVLRRMSLDELPQLINVVRGDMSLVGPRPYLPHELYGQFGSHAARITMVKPGMTGLWQVSGRSLLSPAQRIELDETYVQCCGARFDLLIMARTVKAVLRRSGAS